MGRLRGLHVYLRGGLGNQLFQYATGLAISEKFNRELFLRPDLLPLAADSIANVGRWPNEIIRFAHSGTTLPGRYQPAAATNLQGKFMQALRIMGDIIPGPLQALGIVSQEAGVNAALKYPSRAWMINSYAAYKALANENRERIGREVRSIRNPSLEFKSLSEEIKTVPTLAIHLRLGDYLGLEHIYGSLSEKFIAAAIHHLATARTYQRIWVFSDSPQRLPEFVFKSLGPDRIIGPELLGSPLENLVLMASGASLIASNSSFSWWAAFLSGAENPVVAPIYTDAKVNNFSAIEDNFPNWGLVNVN